MPSPGALVCLRRTSRRCCCACRSSAVDSVGIWWKRWRAAGAPGLAIPMRMDTAAQWALDIDGLGNPTDQPQDPSIARALAPISHRCGSCAGIAGRSSSGLSGGRDRWRAPLRHAGGNTRVRFVSVGAQRTERSGPACARGRDDGIWRSIVRGRSGTRYYREWGRERIDADLQNIRAALAWAATLGDAGAELGIRLSGPLWNYWQTRGLITEGRRYIEDWIFRPGQKHWCQATNLPGLAFLTWIQDDDARCEEIVKAGIAATEGTAFYSARGHGSISFMALMEFRKGLENVFTMMEYVEEAERLFRSGRRQQRVRRLLSHLWAGGPTYR